MFVTDEGRLEECAILETVALTMGKAANPTCRFVRIVILADVPVLLPL